MPTRARPQHLASVPRKGLLASLLGALFAPRARGAAPRPKRTLFEPLEARVLLSATPTIVGTPLDDTDLGGANTALYGTLGDDIIDGLAGDDVIYADGDGRFGTGGGNDIVTGGAGRDIIDGEAGNDWLEPAGMAAGPDMQKVYGGPGTDTLFLRGFPSDYRFFAYVDPDTALNGLLIEAEGGGAVEHRVAAFEIENIAFGVAVLDAADGTAAPVQTLSAAGAFAVADVVIAPRGATEIVIDLADLYANDINVGPTTQFGGVAFTPAEVTVDYAVDATGVAALGLDPADFPRGVIIATPTAPLTADRTIRYNLLNAGTQGNVVTVTLRPDAGQRFYFSGETPALGRELWMYDPESSLPGSGEPFATAIDAADTLAGGAGGNPQDITALGDTVFWRGESDVAGVQASRWHAYSPNLGYVTLGAQADLASFDGGAAAPVLGLRAGELFWGATGGALQAWRADGTAGASVTLAGNERRLLSDAGGVPAYAARDLDSGVEQLFAVLAAPGGGSYGVVQITTGGDAANRIDRIAAVPQRISAASGEALHTFYFSGVYDGVTSVFRVAVEWDPAAAAWVNSGSLEPVGGSIEPFSASASPALTVASVANTTTGTSESLFFFGTDADGVGKIHVFADALAGAFTSSGTFSTYLGAPFEGLEIKPWQDGVVFSGVTQGAENPTAFVAFWTDADGGGFYSLDPFFEGSETGTIEHLTVDGEGRVAFVLDTGDRDSLYVSSDQFFGWEFVVERLGEIDEVQLAGGHLVYRMTEFGGGTDLYLFDHTIATQIGFQVGTDELSGTEPGSGFVNDFRNVAVPGGLVFDTSRDLGGAPRALYVVDGSNNLRFPAGGVLADSEGAVLDGAWVGTGLRADTSELGLFRITLDGTTTTLYTAGTNFSPEAEVLGRKVLFGTTSAAVNDVLVYDAATGSTTTLLANHLLGAAETVGGSIFFSALDFSRGVNRDVEPANNVWTLYRFDGNTVTALLDLPTGAGGGQHVYEWGSGGDFLGNDSRLYWQQANDATGVEVHTIDLTAADPGATLTVLDVAPGVVAGANYRDAVFVNGRLYWQASATGNVTEMAVWTTDGSTIEKVTGADLRDPFGYPGSLVALGNEVFFLGLDDATGWQGIFQVNDDGITATRITPGGEFAGQLAAGGSTLYFLGLDANGIEQLYSATPGATPAALTRQALTSFTSPDGGMGDLFVGGDGRLYFGRNDAATGRELWVVDAAEAQGARLVVDANMTSMPVSGPYAPEQVVPAPDPDPGRPFASGAVTPTLPVFELSLVDFGQQEGTAPAAGAAYDITITRTSGDLGASTLTLVFAGTGAAPAGDGDVVDGLITRTVDFLAGETEVTFTLQAIADALDESDETFTVALASATFGTVIATPVTVTIRDDDLPPVIAFNVANVGSTPEGTVADGRLLFEIVRNGADLGAPATVRFELAGGSVSADDVYVVGASRIGDGALAASLGLYEVGLGVGQFVAEVEVFANRDRTVEPDETVRLELVATSGLGVLSTTGPLVASGVFTNDDAPNGPPIAVADAYVVRAGQVLSVAAPGLLWNDSDPNGDAIIASQFSQPANGTVSLVTDGRFTYTPNEGFVGTDTFEYRIFDGVLFSELATVTIEVTNAAPVANADRYSVQEGRVLNIAGPGLLANDTDADGDAIIASQFSQPANGTVSLVTDGRFTYTPNEGFVGTDTFEYRIFDGFEFSGLATVTIEVSEGTPIANADRYSVRAGQVLSVAGPGLLWNDSDPNGDAIIASQFSQPANGTVSLVTDGRFTYTPNEGFVGTDTFEYRIFDGVLFSELATVTIEVAGNTAPVANTDSYATRAGTTLTIDAPGLLANDVDPDGDPLQVVLITNPADNGTLNVFADGRLDYTPNPGFVGVDQFTYRISDGFGGQADATVSIDVQATIWRVLPVANATEGDGPVLLGSGRFQVERSGPDLPQATLVIVLSGGAIDPVDGNDIVAFDVPLTVTFQPGQTFQNVVITARGDELVEPDESVRFTLLSVSNGVIDPAFATAELLLLNDDGADLSLSIVLDALDDEIPSGTDLDMLVRVTNDGPESAAGTVRLTPGSGVQFLGGPEGFDRATGLWDFGAIAPGQFVEVAINTLFGSAGRIDILGEILAASTPDPDSTPGNGTANGEDDTSSASIAVTASVPAVYIDSPPTPGTVTTGPEGNPSVPFLMFELRRVGDLSDFTVVDWTLSAGTRSPQAESSDIEGGFRSGSATFLPGEDRVLVSFTIANDAIPEPTEFVALALTGAVNGTLDPTRGAGIVAAGAILDDGDPVVYRVTEWFGEFEGTAPGDAGTLTFRVVRDASFMPVTVSYVVEGTGLPGSASAADIVGGFGTRTFDFAVGETEKLVEVRSTPDRFIEPAESFVVRLLGVDQRGIGRAALGTPSFATLTIIDDDVPGTIVLTEDGLPSFNPVPNGFAHELAGFEVPPGATLAVTPVSATPGLQAFLGTPIPFFGAPADSFVVASEPDFAGTGSVTADFSINGAVTRRTLPVVVLPVNDAPRDPQGNDAALGLTTPEDTPLAISIAALLADDAQPADEPQGVSLSGLFGVRNGTVSVDGLAGTIVFTPAADFNGEAGFFYRAADSEGATGAGVWVPIAVTPVQDAPRLATPLADIVVTEDTPFAVTLPSNAFVDPDGDPILYRLLLADSSALPGWMRFDPATRVLSGTPPQDYNGSFAIRVLALDQPEATTASATLTLVFDGDDLIRLAPASDTGIAEDNVTRDRTPTVEGIAPDGAVSVRLATPLPNGSFRVVATLPVDAAGRWSYTEPVALPDAGITYRAQALNAGGGTLAQAFLTVTFEGSPLLALAAASDTGTPGDDLTRDRTPTFEGEAQPGVSAVRIGSFNDTGAFVPWADVPVGADGRWQYTRTQGIAGPGVLVEARSLDAGGNPIGGADPLFRATLGVTFEGSMLLRLAEASDTGAPGDDITAERLPTFEGEAVAPTASVQIGTIAETDGRFIEWARVAVDADGRWRYTVPSGLSGAGVRVEAYALNAAGNRIDTRSELYAARLDLTFDGAPILRLADASDTGTPGDDITSDRTPTFEGVVAAGTATVQLGTLDSQGRFVELARTTPGGDGRWSFTFPAPFAGAGAFIVARSLNAAGNVIGTGDIRYEASLAITFVDAPLLALDAASDTGAPGDDVTRDRTPAVGGTAPAGADIVILDFVDAALVAVRPPIVVAVGAGGAWSYTLLPSFAGPDVRILARAVDVDGRSAEDVFDFVVTPVNDAPVGVADAVTTPFQTPVVIDVVANDTDVERDAITAGGLVLPANGTLAFNVDGTLTYTPNAGFFGTDTFTYRPFDGQTQGNVTTVTVTVSEGNRAPVAAGDVLSFAEDTTAFVSIATLLGNDSDPDGDALSVTGADGFVNVTVTRGTQGGVDGFFVSSSQPDFNGTGSFSYRIADEEGRTATATVAVTITPVNDAPRLATPLPDIAVDENTPISITLPASAFVDVDRDPFLYRLVLANGDALPDWLTFDPATRVLSGTPPRDYTGTLAVRVLAIEQPEGVLLPTALSTGTLNIAFTGSPLIALDPASDTGTPGDDTTRDRTPTLVGQAPRAAAAVRVWFELPDRTVLQSPVVVPVGTDGRWTYTPTAFVGSPRNREVNAIAEALDAQGNALPSTPLTLAALQITFSGSPLIGVQGVFDPTDRTPTLIGEGLPGAAAMILRFLDFNLRDVLPQAKAAIEPDGTWTYTPAEPIPFIGVTVEATAIDVDGNAIVSPWNPAELRLQFTGSPLVALAPTSDTETPGDLTTRDRTPTLGGVAPPGAVTIELELTDAATALPLRELIPVDADGRWRYTPTTPLSVARSATVGVLAWALDETGARMMPIPLTRAGFNLLLVGSPLIGLDPTSDTDTPGDNITQDRTPTVSGDAPAGAASVQLEFLDASDRDVRPSVKVAVDADGTWRYTPKEGFGQASVTFTATALDAGGNRLAGPSVLTEGRVVVRFTGSPLLALDPASDTDAAGDGITRDRTPTFVGQAPVGAAGVQLEFVVNGETQLPLTVPVDEDGRWTYTPPKPYLGRVVNLLVGATAVNELGIPLGSGALNRAVLELVVRGSPLIALDPASDTDTPFDGVTADRTPVIFGDAPAGADFVVLAVGNALDFRGILPPLTVPVIDGKWRYELPAIPNIGITVEARAIDIDGRFGEDVFDLTVLPANVAPIIAPIAAQTVSELQWLTVDVDASDADEDTLTYELVAGPEGAFIDPDTGVIVWNAPGLAPAGSVSFTVRASDGALSDEETFSVTVLPDYLRVVSRTADANGVTVRFNRVFDIGTINLYDGIGGPGGARLGGADVRLTTAAGVLQPASLILHGDQQGFSLVRSGAPLAGGDYRLTVSAGANAFKDLNGRALDGDANGTAGGDYVATFAGGAAAGARVGVADFMRGPGQPVNLPANGAGLPVRLSGAGAAANAQIAFRVVFDPALLDVSDVVAPAAGVTLVRTFGVTPEGLRYVDVSVTAPASGFAAGAEIARLVASIPVTAPYGAIQRIDVRDVTVAGVAATDDDGVQVVGWLGDATGDAAYTPEDVSRLLRVPAGADSGFYAWPRVDPNIVGDFNNDGRLSILDPLILRAEISGFDRPEIPPLPTPAPAITFFAPMQQPDVPPPPPLVLATATLTLEDVAPLSFSSGEGLVAPPASMPAPAIDWRPSEMLTPLRTPPRSGWIAELLAGKGFKPAQVQTWSVTTRR